MTTADVLDGIIVAYESAVGVLRGGVGLASVTQAPLGGSTFKPLNSSLVLSSRRSSAADRQSVNRDYCVLSEKRCVAQRQPWTHAESNTLWHFGGGIRYHV